MTNPWFKAYGSEYLSDPKFLGMDSHARSCWWTLLCYCSVSEEHGVVRYLDESQLMIQAGVPMGGEEWSKTVGVLSRFESRNMVRVHEDRIEVINWEKRQESSLTNAERQARYRKRNEKVTEQSNESNAREEERRKEKNREEKPHSHLDYLISIPSTDLKELSEKYDASPRQIERKAETMRNYCLSKGKTYKNYRAFLENGLDKDFSRRAKTAPKQEEVKKPLTQEQLAALERISGEVKALGRGMRVTTES